MTELRHTDTKPPALACVVNDLYSVVTTENELSRMWSVCSQFSLARAGSCDSAYDRDILIRPKCDHMSGNNVEVRLEVMPVQRSSSMCAYVPCNCMFMNVRRWCVFSLCHVKLCDIGSSLRECHFSSTEFAVLYRRRRQCQT